MSEAAGPGTATSRGGTPPEPAAIRRALLAQVLDVESVVARTCRLEVRFAPAAVAAYRLVGHRQSAVESLAEGPAATVDLHAGEAVRAVYEACVGVRVYEMHGDLMFAGAERVLRTIERDSDDFSVAILDVAGVDTINDPARALLASMSTTLQAAGKMGYLVDPDAAVIRPDRGFDHVVFGTLDGAVIAAQEWLAAARVR